MNAGPKRSKILVDSFYDSVPFCLLLRNTFKVVIFLILTAYVYPEEISWGTENNPFSFHKRESLDIQESSENNQKIGMKRKSLNLDLSSWFESMYINFDKKDPLSYTNTRLKDPFTMLKSSYRSKRYKDSVNEAASFEKPKDQIWVIPPRYLFLKQSHHTGNFTILFLIRPHTQNKSMKIFRKISFFEGKKYGLSCILRNGRIVFQFHHLLWLEDSTLKYLEVQSKDRIGTTKFHKVMIQYRDDQAKLNLYLDSIEQSSVYLTERGRRGDDRYQIRFHPWDESPLIIGEGFYGALDEMIFSNQIFPIANRLANFGAIQKSGPIFFQEKGAFTSKVFKLPFSQSNILNFQYQTLEPEGSNIFVYFRFSDKTFFADTKESELPFQKIEGSMNTPRSKKRFSTMLRTFKSNNLGKAKYFQWKAIFYSDPLGKKTPVLEEARLIYKPNPPPMAPRNLEVVSVRDGRVTLSFSRNSELDVLNGGRYHIYYGIRPDEALGVFWYKRVNSLGKIPITDRDRLETNDARYQNRIQITLDNAMLYQNMVYAKENPSLFFEYPLLQKNIAYYFWVTACDNAFREDIEYSDHESKPSNYVIARIR